MARENANRDAVLPHKVRSQFFAPPDEFEGCFTTFYQLQLEVNDGGVVSDYLQPEWGNIRFVAGALPSGTIHRSAVSGARCVVTGPSSLPLKFSIGSARMWAIGFLPLGWARFVKADAAELANVVANGEQHPAFEPLAQLSEVLCDPEVRDDEAYSAMAAMVKSAMRPTRDDAKIRQIHRNLMDDDVSSVAALAERSGTSVRTLERITRRYFGFTPKVLLRLMRSLTHFMLHSGTRWTDAMDELYHDQAQFSREFRQFMTMSPSQYARLDHPLLDSFVEARARIWGSAAQTLDRPG